MRHDDLFFSRRAAHRWVSFSCLPGASGGSGPQAISVEASHLADAAGRVAAPDGYRFHGSFPVSLSSLGADRVCFNASGQKEQYFVWLGLEHRNISCIH